MFMLDKVAALIIKDRKLLLVREHKKKTFLLPGGKRKFRESDEQTLRRELREELCVDVRDMKYFGKFGDIYGIIRIIAYICKVEGVMKPSREIEEMKWIDSGAEVRMHKTTKEKIIAELVQEGIIK